MQCPGARRTAPRAGQRNGKSRGGSWGKTQLAQGVIPGLPLRGGNGEHGEQRGAAGGYSISHPGAGNRVAKASVRPAAVADGLPERREPAAPLLLLGSRAAGIGRQPELVVVSDRRMKIAKQVNPLRPVDPMGEGIRDAVLFL